MHKRTKSISSFLTFLQSIPDDNATFEDIICKLELHTKQGSSEIAKKASLLMEDLYHALNGWTPFWESNHICRKDIWQEWRKQAHTLAKQPMTSIYSSLTVLHLTVTIEVSQMLHLPQTVLHLILACGLCLTKQTDTFSDAYVYAWNVPEHLETLEIVQDSSCFSMDQISKWNTSIVFFFHQSLRLKKLRLAGNRFDQGRAFIKEKSSCTSIIRRPLVLPPNIDTLNLHQLNWNYEEDYFGFLSLMLSIPEQLHTLVLPNTWNGYGRDIFQPFFCGKGYQSRMWPPKLKQLEVGVCFLAPLSSLPDSIQHLRILNDQYQNDLYLPMSLKEFRVPLEFCSSIQSRYGKLPPNLTHLYFHPSSSFQCPILIEKQSLEVLELPDEYILTELTCKWIRCNHKFRSLRVGVINSPDHRLILGPKLYRLSIGGIAFSTNFLPTRHLKYLSIGPKFSDLLDKMDLMELKHLKIGCSYPHPLNMKQWPSLEYLELGMKQYAYPLILEDAPSTLRELVLSTTFSSTFTLPSSPPASLSRFETYSSTHKPNWGPQWKQCPIYPCIYRRQL